jgi:hypothetical protein
MVRPSTSKASSSAPVAMWRSTVQPLSNTETV